MMDCIGDSALSSRVQGGTPLHQGARPCPFDLTAIIYTNLLFNMVSESAATSPLDYQNLLSETARNRMPSAIRSLYPAELIPGMISLLSGKPNSDTFPFNRILLELKPKGDDGKMETIAIEGKDLEVALQYSATAGIPKLVDWIEEFQSNIHHRPRVQRGDSNTPGQAWRCSFGNGSQDLLTKVSVTPMIRFKRAVLMAPFPTTHCCNSFMDDLKRRPLKL